MYFSERSCTHVTCFSGEICVIMIFGLLVGFLGWGIAHCKTFTYRGQHEHTKNASSVNGTHDPRIRALRHCGGLFKT